VFSALMEHSLLMVTTNAQPAINHALHAVEPRPPVSHAQPVPICQDPHAQLVTLENMPLLSQLPYLHVSVARKPTVSFVLHLLIPIHVPLVTIDTISLQEPARLVCPTV